MGANKGGKVDAKGTQGGRWGVFFLPEGNKKTKRGSGGGKNS